MDSMDRPAMATPTADLRRRVMDANVPKNEAEWWAHHRIEELEARVETLERVCTAVEAWWLNDGMKNSVGAPYAIFALRAALVGDDPGPNAMDPTP